MSTADRFTRSHARVVQAPPTFGTEVEREEIRRLVEKERALRDVAELIAHAAPDEDVLATLVREASRQIEDLPLTLTRFVGQQELLVMASHEGPAPAGTRIAFTADSLPDHVYRTRLPFRVDDYSNEVDAEMAAGFGIVAGVSVPIIVGDRVWGMFTVTSGEGVLPREAEARLSSFAQLVTASFDSIEARTRLHAVAEHDQAMRSIQQYAAAAPISDVTRSLVDYAATLGGIERVSLALENGVAQSAANPVLSITNAADRPSQSITFVVMAQQRHLGELTVETTLPALPEQTVLHLTDLCEVTGRIVIAVTNRQHLSDVVDEQASLRRIAELAAQGVPLADLFESVVNNALRVFGASRATLLSHQAGAATSVVATAGEPKAETMDSGIVSEDPSEAGRLLESFRAKSPVTVEGKPWGTLTLDWATPPPDGILDRLKSFADLTAVAIANTDNRESLSRSRARIIAAGDVARIVAQAGPVDDILTAICRAASDQLDGQEITLLRFESADTIVAVATYGGPVPPGVRVVHPPGSLSDRVARTQRSVRVDNFDSLPSAEIVRTYGIRSGVGVPVLIEDHLWGAFVSTSQTEPLPPDTESRLEGFAQLTWAAIANTEARESLRRLADEQVALRHVAELVARESPLPAVFVAVVEEAARVLSASSASVTRDQGGKSDGAHVVAEVRPQVVAGAHHAEVPIVVNGAKWGTLTVTSDAISRLDGRDRLKPFADLLAAAIANADHREGLTQSRARVIAAGDEARRRLQRDVHDGAQQRLVHTILILKLARDAAGKGGDVTDLLADALTNAEDANRQLRDILRGILPAALTRNGLAAGIESLVVDTPIPVTVNLDVPRLPTALEITGYFTVAEAITNAVKHAQATQIKVTCVLSHAADALILTIEDDGVGGADPSRGTGLTGLTDRIEASYGTIGIESAAQHGTRIVASIPLEPGYRP